MQRKNLEDRITILQTIVSTRDWLESAADRLEQLSCNEPIGGELYELYRREADANRAVAELLMRMSENI